MHSPLFRLSLATALMLTLSACLNMGAPLDDPPEAIAERVKIRSDSFDGKSFFTSPQLNLGFDTQYFLEAARTLDGSVTYYLDVTTRYVKAAPYVSTRDRKEEPNRPEVVYEGKDFNSYSSARDNEGNAFDVSSVERKFVSCNDNFCSYRERFFVFFPAGYMARHATSGARVRASSEQGVYMDLTVPANYVQGVRLRAEPAG